MRSRLGDRLAFAGLAFGIAACYSALLVAGLGHGVYVRMKAHLGRARVRVRHARQRVTRAGASFVELLRSAV